MEFYDLLDGVEDLVSTYIKGMTPCNAEDLGLDIRAGYRLYVNQDCIAIDHDRDRSLQYYGGFEYIKDDHRVVVGSYVFYSRDASRVDDCIENYYDKQAEKQAEKEVA